MVSGCVITLLITLFHLAYKNTNHDVISFSLLCVFLLLILSTALPDTITPTLLLQLAHFFRICNILKSFATRARLFATLFSIYVNVQLRHYSNYVNYNTITVSERFPTIKVQLHIQLRASNWLEIRQPIWRKHVVIGYMVNSQVVGPSIMG